MAFVIYAALTLILGLIGLVLFVPSVVLGIILDVFLSVGLFLSICRQKKPGTLFCSLTFNLCLSFVAGVQYSDIQMCMHLTSDANTT